MAKDRAVESFRGFDLVAAEKGSSFQGKAWKGGDTVCEIDGSGLDDVLQKLKGFVLSQLGETAAAAPKPTTKTYVAAFRKILPTLSEGHRAMLKAHYNAPGKSLTTTRLAEAAGYAGSEAANLEYGLVGKKLWDEVPTSLETDAKGSPNYAFALADVADRSTPEGEWVWKLKTGVAAAIKQLGLNA